ncbi:protein nessun dorma-like isoform X2 [Ischnura elegans]|uniref:protein nessun dorma-like isoform X2 n=1 Tax=Ischnura elegans TaxID=197161 RepID=UPI001ED8ACEB|nr:protein nessun dorma-like isoform X2 [Ischnura elegans]
MAPVITEFRKTLRQRLNEYREIFSIRDEYDDVSFSVRDVKNLWRDYLSDALAPRGWRAIWKVPAEKCLVMSLTYPREILVEVLSIELETFSADVEVIDDKPLPASKTHAALIELYPVDDDNDFVDGWILADDLDKFRFFFVHMWYPWDETDSSESWSNVVLKKRLNLLYDLETGELSEKNSKYIQHLIKKAHCIQMEMDKAGVAIDECEDSAHSSSSDGSFGSRESIDSEDVEVLLSSQLERMDIPDGEGETMSAENEESLFVRMVELHNEMKYIQEEVELLGNSIVRQALANEKLKLLIMHGG